jgi:hypothetical protein
MYIHFLSIHHHFEKVSDSVSCRECAYQGTLSQSDVKKVAVKKPPNLPGLPIITKVSDGQMLIAHVAEDLGQRWAPIGSQPGIGG